MESSRTYRGETRVQRTEHRRTRLIDAAVDVYGTVGYRAATVEDICTTAGLSKRYFYESFTDPEALLLACYQRCSDEIHSAMVNAVAVAADTLDAQLRGALKGYFEAVDADQRRARITLLEILGVSPAVDAAWVDQTDRFATSIELLAGGAFERSSLPAAQRHIIAEGLIGAVTTAATLWLLRDRDRSRKQLINAMHVHVLAVLERLPRL